MVVNAWGVLHDIGKVECFPLSHDCAGWTRIGIYPFSPLKKRIFISFYRKWYSRPISQSSYDRHGVQRELGYEIDLNIHFVCLALIKVSCFLISA